jgi:hypothetical protein
LCKSITIHVKKKFKGIFLNPFKIIDPCPIGSKYIKMHKFERRKFFSLIEATFCNKYAQKMRVWRRREKTSLMLKNDGVNELIIHPNHGFTHKWGLEMEMLV